MKTITEYRKEITDLMQQYNSIESACANEGRDPSKQERDEMAEILGKCKEIKALVDVQVQKQSFEDELRDKPEPAEKPPVVAVTRDEKDKQLERDRFPSFGAQLRAVMDAGRGARIDPRLWNTNRAATGLSEGVPSDGGFLVQTDFAADLIKQVWQTGMLANRCRRIPISGNANSIKINGIDETSRATGSRWGGVRGYWTAEAGEKVASKPKFRQIQLSLNKLIGLCYGTDELLDDAGALEAVIRQAFVDEFAYLVDDAIINGSGAGQPLGVMNSGSVITESAETGQAAATVVYENIVKMWSRLFAKSRANAVWLISQDVEPQLHTMSLSVGTGGVPVYMPAGGASASPYSTLFGRPVIPIEQCQTLGTAGDIILADLNGGYIMAEKGGMTSDMSIHVRFVYDESVFRFVMRLDGQPVLASPVTPANGGSTQSHFVTLETRS
jgi:HK97 family phage major capsid protein